MFRQNSLLLHVVLLNMNAKNVREKSVCHNMQRRMVTHNYALPGIYHITLHVAEEMGLPLGQVEGSLEQPDNTPGGPHVMLTPIGKMVREELVTSITAHYPMVVIDAFIIMPEHLHFIMVVQDRIVSSNGKTQTIGQIIAGFKKGCNRRYWEITHQGKPDGTQTARPMYPTVSPSMCPTVSPSEYPSGYKVPSNASSGRQVLFTPEYCDVIPFDAAQLATQRAYIAGNPRSRLQRSSNRAWLTPQRSGIVTALTLPALRGFLQREHLPATCTPEHLEELLSHLLLTADATAPSRSLITCQSYGSRQLLERPLLPVVCHRADAARFQEQKQRCLEEAARGAVLVSARIAKGEQAIMDEAIRSGYPVVLLPDNGFPDRYHPSAERQALCADGRLLLITPWQYHYRRTSENITVAVCKTMNCVAQALCRTKDNWWQQPQDSNGFPVGILQHQKQYNQYAI